MIRLLDDRERRASRERKKRKDGDYRSTAAETPDGDLLSCIPLLGTIGRAREVTDACTQKLPPNICAPTGRSFT